MKTKSFSLAVLINNIPVNIVLEFDPPLEIPSEIKHRFMVSVPSGTQFKVTEQATQNLHLAVRKRTVEEIIENE